uniref:Uncharacterized protein n=1 Tax=Octopus bimaculoides TaxID=37653 RepID=A0A0L8I9M9_OCTBM
MPLYQEKYSYTSKKVRNIVYTKDLKLFSASRYLIQINLWMHSIHAALHFIIHQIISNRLAN